MQRWKAKSFSGTAESAFSDGGIARNGSAELSLGRQRHYGKGEGLSLVICHLSLNGDTKSNRSGLPEFQSSPFYHVPIYCPRTTNNTSYIQLPLYERA